LKPRIRYLSLSLLAFVLLTALAACSSPTPKPDFTSNQIKALSVEALGTVEAYRFDMSMSMEMEADDF
jgi:hypothetical protein